MLRPLNVLLALVLMGSAASPGLAQESQFMSDLRREGEHIARNCSSLNPTALASCAYTLVASYPFHLSLGSLAPGNGFAFGVALSERYTPRETWRVTFSGDAVASFSGSNRLGGYVKFIHSPAEVGVVVTRPGDPPVRPRRLKFDTWVADVFAQRTSLKTIGYFGQEPNAFETARTSFGERQVMFGGSIVLPMSGASWLGALRPALLGLGGHFKTGHRSTPQNRPPRGADRDREVLLCRRLCTQVGVDFGAPAAWSAFEHVRVM